MDTISLKKFNQAFLPTFQIRFSKLQRIVRIAALLFLNLNCFHTMKTYTNAFPYPKDINVAITEIEKFEIDTNDLIKVQIKDHTKCIQIGYGSYYIHYRLNLPNYGCNSFNQTNASLGTLSFHEISNSAILHNDKIILDFSSLPKDKFFLVNPSIDWGIFHPKSYGYVADPKIDSPFINAFITNDYKYVLIKKKEKTYVFNTIDDKGLLRRLEKRDREDKETIEFKENKIIKTYKNKLQPLKFISIKGLGMISIRDRKKRLFYQLNHTENLYDIQLSLSKEESQDTNYLYIPLLPFSLIADILISPIVVPVVAFYNTVYLLRK